MQENERTFRLIRNGALWYDKDGGVYVFHEEQGVFSRPWTGEVFVLIETFTEDDVLVG